MGRKSCWCHSIRVYSAFQKIAMENGKMKNPWNRKCLWIETKAAPQIQFEVIESACKDLKLVTLKKIILMAYKHLRNLRQVFIPALLIPTLTPDAVPPCKEDDGLEFVLNVVCCHATWRLWESTVRTHIYSAIRITTWPESIYRESGAKCICCCCFLFVFLIKWIAKTL
jgi:hypothetical protein